MQSAFKYEITEILVFILNDNCDNSLQDFLHESNCFRKWQNTLTPHRKKCLWEWSIEREDVRDEFVVWPAELCTSPHIWNTDEHVPCMQEVSLSISTRSCKWTLAPSQGHAHQRERERPLTKDLWCYCWISTRTLFYPTKVLQRANSFIFFFLRRDIVKHEHIIYWNYKCGLWHHMG